MYQDISKFAIAVSQDQFSSFFRGLEIAITGFGTWDQTNISQISNFIITDYEVIYLLRGSTILTCEGREYQCRAGDAVLIEPFHSYSARCTGAEPVRYLYLHFAVTPYPAQQELVQLLRGSAELPLYSGQEFAQLHHTFETLCEPQQRSRQGHAALLHCALEWLLITMVRSRESGTGSLTSSLRAQELELIHRAVELVQCSMSSPVRVAQVAAGLGVSENKLYKSFMDVLKVSPSRYFMQLKIKKAQELICTTGMTMEEIAFATGFSSAFHFSKAFKNMLGVSPSSLRREQSRQT